MRRLFWIVLFLVPSAGFSQKINISLYNDYSVTSYVATVLEGSFTLLHAGIEINELNELENLYITLVGKSITVTGGSRMNQTYSSISFKPVHDKSILQLRPVNPVLEARKYTGKIKFTIDFNRLLVVTEQHFNDYLSGVVEAEGGPSSYAEYYKAQALLCRTYAMANRNRHTEEGFHLCDGTHCQAYKGLGTANEVIAEAVKDTERLVLRDMEGQLVTAAYHSNSGGYTEDAMRVWLVSLPYLKSFYDPYSLKGRNSRWEKKIDRQKWLAYLKQNVSYAPVPPELTRIIQIREADYSVGELSIPYVKIRDDWNLRSSFFSVYDDGKSILLKGRGYGHGVGMSQEGAMEMAKEGFTFSDIIQFYFRDVYISEVDDNPFNP